MASLNQFAWVPGSATYQFGYNSIPNMQITGAPADTNFQRGAMLHSKGQNNLYHLYYFKGSTADTIYQFTWNGSSYAYGANNAIPEMKITGAPADADASSFAMLHSGNLYHLYLRKLGDPGTLYQFTWDGQSYAYGANNAIPELKVTNFPTDTDWNRWGMLHDGNAYRFYTMQLGNNDKLYQSSWNGQSYEFGFNSINELVLTNTPANSNFADFSMLFDGSAYRFYMLAL